MAGEGAFAAAQDQPAGSKTATPSETHSTRWQQAAGGLPAFGLVIALALALRICHTLSLRPTIWFENLDLDPQFYDDWGREIAAGDWVGDQVFFVDPLYAHFLGLVYTVFGHDLLAARLIQCGLDVGTVVLVGVLGRQVAGPIVGNAAALLYTIYAPAIFSTAEIEKTTLGTFLSTLAVVLVLRRGALACGLGGISLALAVLCRGNVLVFAVPMLILLVRSRGRWQWREPAAFLAAVSAVLGLVIWRNDHVGGQATVVSSFGQNLYIGNNPSNTTGAYTPLPFVRPNAQYEERDFRRAAEAEVGHRLTVGEVSDFWADQAMTYVADNPGRALEMFGRKLALLLNDYEVPDNQSVYVVTPFSAILSWPLLSFAWLLPLALLGVAAPRRAPPVRLLAGLVGSYFIALAVFFVLARFRLTVIPLLSVLAAVGLSWLVSQLLVQRYVKVALAVSILLVVGLVSLRPLQFYDQRADSASALYNLSVLQARVGDTDEAVASLRSSLKIQPDNEYALSNLGLLELQQGELAKAAQAFEALTRLKPEWPDYWIKLGEMREALGQRSAAIDAFERALALDADNKYVMRRLARLEGMPPG